MSDRCNKIQIQNVH